MSKLDTSNHNPSTAHDGTPLKDQGPQLAVQATSAQVPHSGSQHGSTAHTRPGQHHPTPNCSGSSAFEFRLTDAPCRETQLSEPPNLAFRATSYLSLSNSGQRSAGALAPNVPLCSEPQLPVQACLSGSNGRFSKERRWCGATGDYCLDAHPRHYHPLCQSVLGVTRSDLTSRDLCSMVSAYPSHHRLVSLAWLTVLGIGRSARQSGTHPKGVASRLSLASPRKLCILCRRLPLGSFNAIPPRSTRPGHSRKHRCRSCTPGAYGSGSSLGPGDFGLGFNSHSRSGLTSSMPGFEGQLDGFQNDSVPENALFREHYIRLSMAANEIGFRLVPIQERHESLRAPFFGQPGPSRPPHVPLQYGNDFPAFPPNRVSPFGPPRDPLPASDLEYPGGPFSASFDARFFDNGEHAEVSVLPSLTKYQVL